MERLRFVLSAFGRGLPPGWGLIRYCLSVLGLLGIVAGLRIAGLPIEASATLGVVVVLLVTIEGAFAIYTQTSEQLKSFGVARSALDPAANPSPTSLERGITELTLRAAGIEQERPVQGDRWYCDRVIEWLETAPAVLSKSGGSEEFVQRFKEVGRVYESRTFSARLLAACEEALQAHVDFLTTALDTVNRSWGVLILRGRRQRGDVRMGPKRVPQT